MNETPLAQPTAHPAGMLCPVCKVGLLLSERQGIEIDYCPQCRGVWLDRGELDKIIERSDAHDVAQPKLEPPYSSKRGDYAPSSPWSGDPHHRDDYHETGRHGGRHPDDRRGHGRGGFLGRLFDH